ncbi:MAG: lyase domain protein repeat-containing protein [Rhodocyclaceae bacterium]|nr:lyase domain protein repeat-containing protein [Rhodocyclaceae bacterium]
MTMDFVAAMQQPRALASLLTELHDDDPVARRWAVCSLAACPDAATALVDRLKCEDDSSVRKVILSALTRMENAIATTCLVECLCGDDPVLCNEAIKAVKELPPNKIANLILIWLSQDNARITPSHRGTRAPILVGRELPQLESWRELPAG